MGQTGTRRPRPSGLPLVPCAGRASTADVLQRRLRPRVEDPQQSVVRAAAGEEARQGDLPALRLQRRQGAPRVDAIEAARLRPCRAQGLACRPSTLGGRPHRARRRWGRRVRPRELPAALPAVPREGDARVEDAETAGVRLFSASGLSVARPPQSRCTRNLNRRTRGTRGSRGCDRMTTASSRLQNDNADGCLPESPIRSGLPGSHHPASCFSCPPVQVSEDSVTCGCRRQSATEQRASVMVRCRTPAPSARSASPASRAAARTPRCRH